MTRATCHIGFGGLLGLLRDEDRGCYVALIPNVTSGTPFQNRLPKMVCEHMSPHRARILVRGGKFAATCGKTIITKATCVCHPDGSNDLAWPIEFEHLTLVEPSLGSLPAAPPLAKIAALLQGSPGSDTDKEISDVLFKQVYKERLARLVGRIEFRPGELAATNFDGWYRFMYTADPARELVREVCFSAEVDPRSGVVIEVRGLGDSTGTSCDLRILPEGPGPFEIHFENSRLSPWPSNPDFALHYNLCNTPQNLLGRLPFPYRVTGPAPNAAAGKAGTLGGDPQCSPADYGNGP